jgi:hypothetical protein
MSKEPYSDRFLQEMNISGISDAISAAFNNPLNPPKPNSSESSVKKRFRTLKEKSAGGKETFLTEAELNELEEDINKPGYIPLTYEEMVKELDDLRSGIRSKDDDLKELRKRLNKCQDDIKIREEGFSGIDKTLHDIHSQSKQSKVLLKKFKSLANFPKSEQNQ